MITKHRRLTTPLVAIVLLLVLSLQLPFQESVRATELSADNFNDMDYNGWGTYGTIWDRTESTYYPAGVGNFSAEDRTLKVTGPGGNWTRQSINVAYMNHSINFGTWSFDLFVVDNPGGEIIIHLISDHYNPPQHMSAIPGPYLNDSYCFMIATHNIGGNYNRPMISFWRFDDGSIIHLDEYVVGPSTYTWTNCWTHFDVTRNSTGYFNIYINETLRISRQEHATIPSGYFVFAGQSGQAIDNVVILDYIVPHPPSEPTTPPIPGLDLTAPLIIIGTIELIIIILLVVLHIRRRP